MSTIILLVIRPHGRVSAAFVSAAFVVPPYRWDMSITFSDRTESQ